MYATVLLIHSWLRYPVLLLGIALLALAFLATRGGRPSPALERLHGPFVGLLDAQMMLGLLLYFVLSPISTAAMADMGAAMKDPTLRFFGVEHIATMGLAVAVAHVGRARARRADEGARARIVWRAQSLWLLLTLVAIPWPGLDIGRPLLRF